MKWEVFYLNDGESAHFTVEGRDPRTVIDTLAFMMWGSPPLERGGYKAISPRGDMVEVPFKGDVVISRKF